MYNCKSHIVKKELEIERIFNSISSHLDFEGAIASIEELQIDSNELFDFLWRRAVKPQSAGGHVLISALTLYKLNIACSLTAEQAIEQMCLGWDVSLEEVPWYLANQFSKEEIVELTKKMHFEKEEQNTRLKTISYWIGNKA